MSDYATTTLVEDLLSAGHSRNPAELDLIRQYAHLGICSGKYLLLLLPDDAVRFAEDAAERGIGILGPEYWYGPGWEWWPSPDYGALIGAADFVEKSLERVKEDIQHHLPDGVAFVSLVLHT